MLLESLRRTFMPSFDIKTSLRRTFIPSFDIKSIRKRRIIRILMLKQPINAGLFVSLCKNKASTHVSLYFYVKTRLWSMFICIFVCKRRNNLAFTDTFWSEWSLRRTFLVSRTFIHTRNAVSGINKDKNKQETRVNGMKRDKMKEKTQDYWQILFFLFGFLINSIIFAVADW